MSLTHTQARIIEALAAVVLLFVPIVLAIFPLFVRNGFPGPFTRTDAILVFFIGVPLVFALLATYRVAQYHGLIGTKEDTF